MLQPYETKPVALFEKPNAGFVSWRPGILCRRNRFARCWSSAAYPCITRTWLGTVPEVMLEDVKGKWPIGFGSKLFTPKCGWYFDVFCWFNISCLSPLQIVPNPVSSGQGDTHTHKEQVVAYPVGRRIFQSGVQPWGIQLTKRIDQRYPTMMNVSSRLALSTVRFFHEESKRFWQG